MNASHDQFLELCAGYALGALDAGDRAALAAHLREGCDLCRAELAALQGAAADVAASAEPMAPPPAVKARVLEAIRREPPAARTSRPERGDRRTFLIAGIGALVAAVALLTIGYFRIRAERDAQDAEIARLKQAVHEQALRDRVRNAKNAIVVTLAGTDDAATAGMDRAFVRMVYDPDSDRAVLRTEGLRPLAGRSFELWAIYDTGPKSLGLVRVNEDGSVDQLITTVGGRRGLAAFGISNEVEGGSPDKSAPQGKVGLAGALGS